MGSLYVAKDHMNRLVAVKLLRQDMDHERFEREAHAMAALQHTNIVHIYDYGEDEGTPYIVMEYLRGENLAELIRRKAPIPVPTKLRIIEELCDGLADAHAAGIIHRDIKPANLMWAKDTLKILDFGIARVAGSETRVSASGIVGTTGYLSPEQIQGGAIDARADLFAVGVVFHELLSYTPAFYQSGDTEHKTMDRILKEDPQPLASLCPQLDPQIVAIVNRALLKDPAQRYPDAHTMRQEIAATRARQVAVSATQLLPRPSTTGDPDVALAERLQKVDDLLARDQVTPAEELLRDMTREYPASRRVEAQWRQIKRKRLEAEQLRLAETAAESACRRAESAIADGALAVAVRYADEALVHVADHPEALRLRAAALRRPPDPAARAGGTAPPALNPTEIMPTPGRATEVLRDLDLSAEPPVSPTPVRDHTQERTWAGPAAIAALMVVVAAVGLAMWGGLTRDDDLGGAFATDSSTARDNSRSEVVATESDAILDASADSGGADRLTAEPIEDVTLTEPSPGPGSVTNRDDTGSAVGTLLANAQRQLTRGEWPAATESFRAALADAPGHPDATAGLAQVFLRQGREALDRQIWSTAERSCNNARQYGARTPLVQACLDEAQAGVQREADAARVAAQRASLENLLDRARGAHDARRLDEALALYSQVLERDENHREGQTGRERVLIDQNRVRRFVRQATEAETAGDLGRAVSLMQDAAGLDASPSIRQELTRLSAADQIINRRE